MSYDYMFGSFNPIYCTLCISSNLMETMEKRTVRLVVNK